MKITNIIAVTTILFLLLGCGGGDSTTDQQLQNNNLTTTLGQEANQTDNPDDILEFKTEGSYDLSSYLTPSLVAKKDFRVRIYIDDIDLTDTDYGTLANTTFYSQSINKNNNQITFEKDDQIDKQYTILDDRIQIENSTVSNPVDIVRFADIGDYVGNIDKNISTNFKIKCKLKEHLESKNNFQDILSVVCQSQNGLYQGKYFFAKDIGSILEIDSLCRYDSANDLNCTNIVTEYRIAN